MIPYIPLARARTETPLFPFPLHPMQLPRGNFNGNDRPAAMLEVDEDHLKSLPGTPFL